MTVLMASSLAMTREAFLSQREVSGRSPLTISRYRRILGKLPEEWWPIDQLHIQTWLGRERAAGKQATTVAVDFAVVRVFCRWAVEAGCLASDPTRIFRLKPPRKLPYVPSQTEIQAVLRAARHQPEAAKWEAIVLVFIDTGLRLWELSRLRWEDVRTAITDRAITVHNAKGSEDRIVRFGSTTAQALTRWMTSCGVIHETDWVFPTRTHRALPRQRIDEKLKALGKQAGLPRPLSAHKFRHFFATSFLTDAGN